MTDLPIHLTALTRQSDAYGLGYAMGQDDMRKYLLADDEGTYAYGHREGFAAGLNAAREAVAALDAYYLSARSQADSLAKGNPEDRHPWKRGHLPERDDTLADIRDLKERP